MQEIIDLGLSWREAVPLVQITDCHLYADPDRRLRGAHTRRTLEAVLGAIGVGAGAAAILATGDLTQDGEVDAYRYLADRLARTALPAFCLPGNHDTPSVMAAELQGPGVHQPRRVLAGAWQVVLLDSTVAGQEDGALGEARLAALEAALAAAPDRFALIALHHPPVTVPAPVPGRTPRRAELEDAGALFAVLARHRQVRAVVFGHAHQPFEGLVDGLQVFGSPATSLQFDTGVTPVRVAPLPPAYRRLDLTPDGHVESGVRWVPAALHEGHPGRAAA